MKIETKLTQEQVQRLSMIQLQSLQILALSTESLQDMLQKEYTENPFMDYKGSQGSKANNNNDFLQFMPAPDEDYIKNFILEQLNPNKFTTPEWTLLKYLAGCVDEDGFLLINEEDLEARLHIPRVLLQRCIAQLRQLDPAGICTSSIPDCLKEQLARKDQLTPELQLIIDNHLEDLGKNKFKVICNSLQITKEQLLPLLKTLRSLKPRPLEGISNEKSSYIIPDVIISNDEKGFRIILNDSWLSSYSISDYYIRMMAATTDPAIKTYFQNKYYRCYMLMRNIEQRRKTLIALSQAIWDWQADYFLHNKPLKTMTLQDIANQTNLHPSTISRAIKNKFLQTPSGTIAFKNLFQKGLKKGDKIISRNDITLSLALAVKGENSSQPLSDADLAQLLSKKYECPISRRVVAKYRVALHIANSYERKI